MSVPRNYKRCGGCGKGMTDTEPFVGLWDEETSTLFAVYHLECRQAAEEKVRKERPDEDAWSFVIGGTKYMPEEPKRRTSSSRKKRKGRSRNG